MQKTTFTLSEAADLLRCHKETLRRAILDGTLQAARLGRGYRISRVDLQKFWNERGGGELFDRAEVPETQTAEEREAELNARKKGPKKDDGPHQLTLPL
ncbi:helix-turn-helix domain-containing protein [Desulfovibrio sp. OttesenSCG-928-F07]|nr:helix-turn-helix domain-containing protein [Desulfovibrio sp. OttesenSCG-928-F07]